MNAEAVRGADLRVISDEPPPFHIPMIAQPLRQDPVCCPLCRLPLAPVGRVVSLRDTAGHWFTFEICLRCTLRLERLPIRLQLRQLDAAVGNLWRHPERYELTPHDTEAEATLAAKLRAAQLRGEF